MTKLLEEMISQIHQLSPDEQDAIASRFLAELQDEQKWKSRFTTTTDDQWDGMAAMVRQEIAKGETVPLTANWNRSCHVCKPQKPCLDLIW
jgi:hypothetical protein